MGYREHRGLTLSEVGRQALAGVCGTVDRGPILFNGRPLPHHPDEAGALLEEVRGRLSRLWLER